MDVIEQNIVTTPGASEPQGSAVVDGSGSKTGSNVAGPLRSISSDREGAGVASQAPATLPSTSAEDDGHQAPCDKKNNESRLKTKLLSSNSQKTRELSLTSAISNLKSSIKSQNKIISELLEGIDHLSLIKEKSKSPQVREAIDIVVEKVEKLHSNKPSLHGAFYEVEKAATRNMTEQKTADPQPEQSTKNDKQEAILKACEALAVSLAKQQEDINALKHTHHTPGPSYASKAGAQRDTTRAQAPLPREHEIGDSNQMPQTQGWTMVNRPKPKNKKQNKKPAEVNRKIKRPLPDSISVKPENGETFTDILKTIKEKVNISSIGSEVSSIKESRSGGILIRLGREDKNRDELVKALKTNLGNRAVIKGLVSLDDVDIQDLDKVTTATEVECSIRSALGLPADDSSIKVKNIRPAYAGTQRATVRLRSADAITIAKKGRIRIGWINARVRLKETASRCFKCLGYGHTTHTCRGPDRAKACSLCTSESHRASSCTSPPKCAACLDMKEQTDHFPGSGKCTAYRLALSKKNIEQREPERVLDAPIHQRNE